MKDRREYVRITVDLPENPKLHGLDPRAKWLYITALCYAGRHLTDGHAPRSVILKTAEVSTRFLTTLLKNGVVHGPRHECESCPEPRSGWVVIHDYLRHQRSRSDADRSRRAGQAGAAARWGADGNANRNADSNAISNAIPNGQVEVEGESGLGSQSGVGRTDSRETDFAKIAQELGQPQAWARRVVADVLKRASQPPGDVTKYVLSAIRAEPARYQPTQGPPPVARLCDHGRDRLTCPDCAEETA